MSGVQPLVDVLGLANRPVGADCVKWSEDGVLAVAAGHSAVLLRPGDLAGPRAFASPGGLCDVEVLHAPGRPAKPTEDAHHELAHLRAAAMVSQYPSLQAGLAARCLGWSPAGCSAAAGCLLAVVTNDHQVLVYGPPAEPRSEWQQVANLSGQLLDHLEHTGWRDLQPLAPQEQQQQQQGEEGCLRLRGGGRTKRKTSGAAGEAGVADADAPIYRPDDVFAATVGQEVEVMSAEEGLYGGWFTGTIQRLAGGWALVAYDELREAEGDDSPPLREWFPIPGQRQQAGGPLAGAASGGPDGGGGHTVHGIWENHHLRPAPPPRGVGTARAVGDTCDAFVNGAWWETARVVEVQDGGQKLVVEVDNEQEPVDLALTRTTLRFTGGQWLAASTCAADAAAAAAAAAAAEAEQPGKKKGGRKPRQQKEEQQQHKEAQEGEEEEAPGDERPSKKRRGSKATAAAVAAAGAAEPPEAQQERQEQQGAAAQQEQEPEAEQQEQQQTQAPGKKGAGLRSPRKQRQPTAAHAGDGATPRAARDEPGSSAAAAAAAAAGASSAGDAKSKKASASSTKKAPASSAKKAAPAYEVPADFDPSVLPEVDLSSVAEAKRSMPTAFARRFLALRRLVPEAELPSYPGTSSHLKGIDAELVGQAVAELLHVHGDALGALGGKLDAKWLNTEGRTKLRNVWDRTRNKLLGGFKVAEGDATEPESDEETEDEQPQAGHEGGGDGTNRRRAGRASSAGPSGGTLYGEGGEEGEETEGEGAGQHKAGDGDSDDELPTGRGKGRKRRSSAAAASTGAALDFPPHEMPEGFSWRSLPGVDFSNESAAKKTLLQSAVRRFLTLRAEYPEEERPSYEKKSSHLRGRDAWLVDRVTREFLAAYAQLMDDLGWTPKSFQTYWLSRLRAVWDKTTARLSEGFKLEPEPAVLRSAQEAAEVATMAVGADPQAAEALATRGPQLQHRSPAKPPKKSASRKSLASLAGEEEEEGAATAARSARSGGTRDDGYGSERSDGLVLASSSAKRKRKDLAAATAAARMRRDSTGGAELSSAEYQHRLLGSCCISCAWSPAVDMPTGAAQPTAAAAEAAGGEATTGGAAAPAPAAQRCCFLALGAKAGRIWLWRYRLPAQYRLDQPQGDVSDSFELVGCLAGSPGAWVNSLAWQLLPSSSISGGSDSSSSLVLVAGCSDGSVLLYGADAQQLATTACQQAPSTPVQGQQQQPMQQQTMQQQRQQPMQRWCVACQPDCRVVTTLSVQLQPSSSSGDSASHLLVAVGNAAGSLVVWRSGPLSSGSGSAELAKALGSGATSIAAVSIQGTRPVTGLSWLPPCQRQQGAPLLLASTQDGTVACWRLAEASGSAGLALLPADGAPQPCSKRKKRSAGHCAFGLAVSPGGLFAAVVRLALSPAAEIVKQLQVHERVVQGLVQLDRLAGPGAPLEVQAALSAALASHSSCPAEGNDDAEAEQQRLVQGCLAASSAWEAAALLRLHAKWQGSSAAEAAADAPMGDAAGQEVAAGAGDGGLVPPLAAAVLHQLEQPMLDLLHGFQARQAAAAGPASGEAGTGEALLPQVPLAVWRSLQLATALRHLLDPARVQQEQRQQAKKQLRKVGGTAPQPDMLSLQQLLKAEPVEAAVGGGGGAIDMAIDEGGSDEEEEEDGQQQQQQQPALTPELIAQHGAFASLFLAAAPLPPPPQPVINKKKQKALEKQQAARAQAQAAQQLEAQQRAAAAAAAAAAVLAVVDVPEAPLVQEWRAATERNEMLLLQRHLAATLAPLQPPEDEEGMDVDGSGPGGEGATEPAAAAGAATDAAGDETRLSQLLMADWITLNVRDPGMLQEMDVMAASAYLHTNEEMLPHGAAMPAREHSTLFDEPVAVAGSGVAAATQAVPPSAGGATLPRCPATLLLCEGRPHWSCRACGRRYRRPQGAGNTEEAGDPCGKPLSPLPTCIFCGLPLGSVVPAVLFSPPCCS